MDQVIRIKNDGPACFELGGDSGLPTADSAEQSEHCGPVHELDAPDQLDCDEARTWASGRVKTGEKPEKGTGCPPR